MSAKLLSKRQALVLVISERLDATSEEVAKLLSREQVKTLAYGRSEIGAAAAWFSRYSKMELSDKTGKTPLRILDRLDLFLLDF